MASPSAAPDAPEAQTPAAASAPVPDTTDANVLQLDVEVEEEDINDTDSSMGDDLQSYTTSLKSTVLNYRYENGRRFHAFADDEGKYMFPNDDEESDRLDLYHHVQTLSLGGELHLAPIGDNPQRILDLGTGTGIWAIDCGDKYPSAEIIGNDISPIQPSLVPPNVKFEVDDIEEEWVYGQKFDFIHGRYLTCSIKDWPRLVGQAYKHTKPGGWVEFQDFDLNFYTSTDGTFKKDGPFGFWVQKVIDSVAKYGYEVAPGPMLEEWVKAAGFVNVVAKVLPLPLGTWPKDKTLKEIGAFNLISIMDNLEGMSLKPLVADGWTPEEAKVLYAQVRTNMKDKSARIQHNYYVCYGQKPENAVD